jgi:hypothetical protein
MLSVFGASDWLKDIRSVDVRSVPDWLISNYFYNEMNIISALAFTSLFASSDSNGFSP